MTTRISLPEGDLLLDSGKGEADFHRISLRRTASKKKRKIAEMEEKRRIRGDSHWSKILQVNMETNGIRHKRCIRMCRKVSLTAPPTCRLGLHKNGRAHTKRWIQSKRKYEVSPVHEAAETEKQEKDGKVYSGCMGTRNSKDRCKTDAINEDYLIISQANHFKYHPELKRSGALKPPGHLCVLTSASVSASAGRVADPLSASRNEKATQVSAAYRGPIVNINIEFADQSTPVECRSQFAANPLRLNQRQLSQTSIMTPTTRALSRSQQLRQSRNKYMKLLQKAGQLSPGRSPLTGTISAPAKPGLGEKGTSPMVKRRQIKTWPLACRKQLRSDEDDINFGDSEMELPFIQEMFYNYDRFGIRGKSSLKDFSIDFKDLNLGELSRKGRHCKIYKGRWHGDVIVHVFGKLRQKDKDAFWANLNKLCRIRHENIMLFMAACTSQPNLAVVTCNPQGKSLYEHIHVQREKTTMHTKVGVLRQIALGMGYLHAKGIVLRKLNSKNIFIGHKVKVSVMDFGFPEVAHDRSNYGCIPRGHLTYIAPELLCTIRVIPPRLVPFSAYSPETDVFAFGTLMYEVLAGISPFNGALPEKIIWQVCAGHRQVLHSLRCNTAIKTLIEDCWAHEPLYRPEFRELCKDLQRHSPLHKKHSSSEPERLNKTLDLFD
ncbi:hypothetical protein BsWGS_01105 [Bradybaena similaris]